MTTKKPVLPKWLKEHAILEGVSYAEDVCGYTDAESKEYQDAFWEAANRFCEDYMESLTGRKDNPTIPVGFSISLAFAPDLYEGEKSFLGKRVSNQSERTEYARQMKRAATMLNSIFTMLESGLTPSRDFNYEAREGSREDNLPKIMSKTKNRYRRAFTLSVLLGMLDAFYNKIQGKDVALLIDRLLEGKNWKRLQTKPANLAFGEAIKNAMKKGFGTFDIVKEVESELKKADFLKESQPSKEKSV
jgi:hypothetical protein